MLEFNAEIFEAWHDDYECFNNDLRYFCVMQFRAYGVHADFVPNVTRQIHAQWVEACAKWLSVETSHQTSKLSHLKKASLLLYSLTSIQFLGNFEDYEYDEVPKVTYRGSKATYETSRQDLIDAREIILSLDYVLNVIHYFELNRVDRIEEFKSPLTADMRHDLIAYFINGSPDPKALYLILKALYLRHSAGGAAN